MRIRKKTKSEIVMPDSFKVHRNQWGMGMFRTTGTPAMLNCDNNLCCLGFLCHAAGFGEEHLRDNAMPIDVLKNTEGGYKGVPHHPFLEIPLLTTKGREEPNPDFDIFRAKECREEGIPETVVGYAADTKLASDAAGINDDESLTLRQREEKLTKLFAKRGIKVEFVGKYPKAVVEEDKEREMPF